LADHHGKDACQGARRAARRIEKEYAVDRFIMLGLWGMESAFGDVVVNQSTCDRFFRRSPRSPGRAAPPDLLEQELLNALVIVERGWSTPAEMIGSWPAPWDIPNGCRKSGSIRGRRRWRRTDFSVRQAG